MQKNVDAKINENEMKTGYNLDINLDYEIINEKKNHLPEKQSGNQCQKSDQNLIKLILSIRTWRMEM